MEGMMEAGQVDVVEKAVVPQRRVVKAVRRRRVAKCLARMVACLVFASRVLTLQQDQILFL